MKTKSTFFNQLFLIVAILFTFSLSAWGGGEVTITKTSFTKTSDNLDTYISYTTAKGGGTSNPAINSNQIRLYQNSSGTGGGTITITAAEGSTLNSVTIGSSMTTSIAYTIGSSSTKSNSSDLNKDGKYIVNDINDKSITFYCMGTTSSSRLYVNHLSVTYTITATREEYSITWMNGEEPFTTTTHTEGNPLNIPANNPESCSDTYNTFVGWYTEQAGTTSEPSTELSGTEASKTTINSDTTFYAVFGDGEIPSSGTESIDFSTKGYANGDEISSVDIAEGINITFNQGTNSNTPKYYTTGTAVRVYGGGYFVVSSTFGAITKIVLTFGTDDGNDITTDYHTYSSGTWTGSSQSVKFTIGGSSGHRKIKAISVTTESGITATGYISTCDGEEVEIPQLSKPTNLSADNITDNSFTAQWNAVDNANEYKITIEGKTYTTTETFYTITELSPETDYTFTVQAIGDNENYKNSEIATSETIRTLNIKVANIAEFIARNNTTNTITITGEVTVTAVSDNKKNVWIKDNSGVILIYSTTATTYVAGDKFSGLKGKYQYYNNTTPEITSPTFPNEKTTGDAPIPELVTIPNLENTDVNKYIRIENVAYNGIKNSNATFIDENENSITTYESDSYFNNTYSLSDGQKVNLNAIVGIFNNVPQIYVVSFDVVREPAIYADDKLDFGDVVENKELSKSITITTVDLGESASVSISGKNASCFAVNTNTIEDNSETEITITFTAPEVDIETEYTATLEITGGGQIKEIALIASVYKAYTIKFGNTEKETNAEGKVTEIPTHDGVVGWTTNSVFAIVDEKPNVIDENTIFEENTQLYPVYSITEEGQEEAWTLVTDASTLAIGDKVVIAAANYDYALSTTQNTNNRGSVLIEKDGDIITINNDVQILTLEAGTTSGTFAFNTDSGYLYAASSSSNHLKTQASIKANGSWSIEISNKIATIKAQESSRNWMRFNNSNSPKLFSCYESGQTDIALYKKTGGAITKYNIAGNKTVDNNITFDVENNININTLTIESNFDEAGEVNVTDGALSANKVIIEKTIGQTWCFFSLPYDCYIDDIVATGATGTLTYAPDASSGDYVIAKYNSGWEELLSTSHTLKAHQGYIIGQFTENPEVIVEFPSVSAQTISAPANTTLDKTSDNGFNLIGLPYYQTVTNANLNVTHVSIPNDDGKTYKQEECDADIIATIAPFTSFFVQTKAENIEFTIAAQQNAAPMLRANGVTNKAVITFTDANGGADKTTIINDPSKTTDYEIGHDLTKLIGYASIPQIYSLQGDEMLAFNSLAIDNSTVIPLGVYAHADGEYTFSLSEKSIGDLQGWELYDNETGKTTRLANENLTVNLAQGTHEGRFEIRLQQRITTDCDNSMGDMTTWTANGTLNINNLPADAVVYIYDAVGRMIYAANNNSTAFNYTFAARGVYNIVVRSADNTVSFKTIY